MKKVLEPHSLPQKLKILCERGTDKNVKFSESRNFGKSVANLRNRRTSADGKRCRTGGMKPPTNKKSSKEVGNQMHAAKQKKGNVKAMLETVETKNILHKPTKLQIQNQTKNVECKELPDSGVQGM